MHNTNLKQEIISHQGYNFDLQLLTNSDTTTILPQDRVEPFVNFQLSAYSTEKPWAADEASLSSLSARSSSIRFIKIAILCPNFNKHLYNLLIQCVTSQEITNVLCCVIFYVRNNAISGGLLTTCLPPIPP